MHIIGNFEKVQENMHANLSTENNLKIPFVLIFLRLRY